MLFFFKQKTAYEVRISDWSSDVCSSDLFKVGDRVIAGCGNGGMSEAVAVSVHNVYHLPEAHGFAEGASLLMTYGTSIHALVDRGHIKEGDTLLVLGASGGVGIAAVELGKAFGARVVEIGRAHV